MKKVLLTFAVLGSLLLGACEKEELAAPADKTLIKADKGILCRGCGQWDLTDPETQTTTLRSTDPTATPTITATPATTATPEKTVKPGKGKK